MVQIQITRIRWIVMDRTFIITVGTGRNYEDRLNIAKGIALLLGDMHPDKVIFIGSNDSKKTVENIKEEYYETEYEKLDNSEFHEIYRIDDVKYVFDEISKKINENKNTKIYINYTSGTKSMSVAAALCSVVYKTRLMSLSGERNEYGVVEHQKGRYNTQNLYSVYDQFNLDKMKRYFNIHRYEETIEICEEIVKFPEKETYKQVFDYYDKWDKFNHKNKLDTIDSSIFKDENFVRQLTKNQKAIKIIKKIQEDHRDYYIIADLINNSQRRYEEGKYDDAIARLYRSIELIAQTRLKHEYGIITDDVDLSKIETKVSSYYYNTLKNKPNKKIQLALKQDYLLLKQMNDKLGKVFHENSRYKEILKSRNYSILAHGTNPISKERYDEMKTLTIELATILNTNIPTYIEETKFPQFTLRD